MLIRRDGCQRLSYLSHQKQSRRPSLCPLNNFFWITQKIIFFDTRIAHKGGWKNTNLNVTRLSFTDFKTAVWERKDSPFRSLSTYEKVFEKSVSCYCCGILTSSVRSLLVKLKRIISTLLKQHWCSIISDDRQSPLNVRQLLAVQLGCPACRALLSRRAVFLSPECLSFSSPPLLPPPLLTSLSILSHVEGCMHIAAGQGHMVFRHL